MAPDLDLSPFTPARFGEQATGQLTREEATA